ncbi:hypothetical protein AAFG07_07885 [Bradyrhizobium sp. B097]|uniref:hypothetical protein n=1 Tax=Bradyrhizobium sp. B097 TaxID=3140244 RepID=UPI0031837936
MKYRELPWKRNFKKASPSIMSQLSALKGEVFHVGVTKTLTAAEISATPLKLLKIGSTAGSVSETIPSEDMGPYSDRNRNGWQVVRRDLPKIKKSFYWETPNFGDAATYGTHLHESKREVFQREIHEARSYSISTHVLRTDPSGGIVVHLRIKEDLDKSSAKLGDELLFMLNLLQENCGAIGVVSSDTPIAEYIKTIALDWEIFPPGNAGEVAERLLRGRASSAAARGKIEERIRLFAKLTPLAYLRGSGGFGSYIGAKYADDLVVFENVQYGNALYLLYDDWEQVSKRSRIDLLHGTDKKFDRLPHRDGWEDAFEKILRREKRKRGLK